MQKDFQLTVDIENKIRTPSFEVNTLDLKTVRLQITIIQGMSLVDLTGITVRMSIQKPDKNVIFQECEVVDAKTGLVEIVLDNQAYLLPGKYIAELMCFQGAEVVAVTGSFSYTSTKGILTDKAVESKSEFTAITGKIKEVEDVVTDLRENGTGIDAQARKRLKGLINIVEYGAVGDGVTNDQNAIVSAVADALSKGYALNWGWDNSTFLTTASIPDFHKVQHIGNAAVKRGGDLFYISPTSSQRNKIYVVASGGSNLSDGLSRNQAVARLQTAFNWLENYAPILTGYWEIVMTAGTFSNRAVLKPGLRSENPIEISGHDVGTHPTVPTTIISEGNGARAVGILATDGSQIKCKNIKLVGFNGTVSSAGIKVSEGAHVETSNCHFDSCYYGLSGEKRSKIVVPDGLFTNCGYLNTGTGGGAALRSLMLNNHTIGMQNVGNRSSTAIFRNCYMAMLAQESSTGHVDWCTIEDCNIGLAIRVNARINADGTSFKRNTFDIISDANGHVYITDNNVFGTGNDESSSKLVTTSGGGATSNNLIEGTELSYGTIEKSLLTREVNMTVNTTTNKKVYSTVLKAPFWRNSPSAMAPMKKLYFRIYGTLNGTAGAKRVIVRLGNSPASVIFAAAETGVFSADGYVYFTGPQTQYIFMNSERHLGTNARKGRVNGTNTMLEDTSFSIEGQVDNTADSVVFEMIELGWA